MSISVSTSVETSCVKSSSTRGTVKLIVFDWDIQSYSGGSGFLSLQFCALVSPLKYHTELLVILEIILSSDGDLTAHDVLIILDIGNPGEISLLAESSGSESQCLRG